MKLDSISKQMRGISIIEFMIASALSLLILSIAITIYLAMKRNYQFNIGMAQIHENANLASSIITHDLRQAGSFGCTTLPNLTVIVYADLPWPLKAATVVQGNPWQLLITNHNQTAKQSDSIALQYLSDPITISKRQLANSIRIVLNEHVVITKQDLLMIADCQHAEVFRVLQTKKYVHGEIITLNHKLKFNYNPGATIGKLVQVLYFVADSIANNSRHKKSFDLYRRDLSDSATLPTAMISGVDVMQLRYTLEVSKNIKFDLTADQVSQLHAWAKVILISVYFSFNSEINVFDYPKSWSLWFTNNVRKDRLLHQPWIFTVALRARRGSV